MAHFRRLLLHLSSYLANLSAISLFNFPAILFNGFDKIFNKEIPSTVVYEDDQVLAFRDIPPQAPTHILITRKVKDVLTGLSKAEERHFEILGRLLYTAKLVAKQEVLMMVPGL